MKLPWHVLSLVLLNNVVTKCNMFYIYLFDDRYIYIKQTLIIKLILKIYPTSRSSLASSSSPLPMFHHHYLRPLYTDRACYPLQWVYVILIFTIFFDLFLLTFLYILCIEAKERSYFLSFRDRLCYNAWYTFFTFFTLFTSLSFRQVTVIVKT